MCVFVLKHTSTVTDIGIRISFALKEALPPVGPKY